MVEFDQVHFTPALAPGVLSEEGSEADFYIEAFCVNPRYVSRVMIADAEDVASHHQRRATAEEIAYVDAKLEGREISAIYDRDGYVTGYVLGTLGEVSAKLNGKG